jgi:integrase
MRRRAPLLRAGHRPAYPPREVEVLDRTGRLPVRRRVPLLFTTVHGNPFTDRTWSGEWVKWRTKAGWPTDPKQAGFHALRHWFATTLIANGVDAKEVQRALRHAQLQTTLSVYVHFWPRQDRKRGIVGDALTAARKKLGTR